jgi:hypothetical protein
MPYGNQNLPHKGLQAPKMITRYSTAACGVLSKRHAPFRGDAPVSGGGGHEEGEVAPEAARRARRWRRPRGRRGAGRRHRGA